jgi:hypothetical protein
MLRGLRLRPHVHGMRRGGLCSARQATTKAARRDLALACGACAHTCTHAERAYRHCDAWAGQVLGSTNYPTTSWLLLGTFRAEDRRGPQVGHRPLIARPQFAPVAHGVAMPAHPAAACRSVHASRRPGAYRRRLRCVQRFKMASGEWARYLKFRFLSNYGNEFYCTLTTLRVHGFTMLEEFHTQAPPSCLSPSPLRPPAPPPSARHTRAVHACGRTGMHAVVAQAHATPAARGCPQGLVCVLGAGRACVARHWPIACACRWRTRTRR